MSKIRNASKTISENIFSRMLSFLIPIQHLLIKVKSIMSKAQATMTAGLFTSFGAYMTLQSAIGAIYELIVIILLILAAIIVVLWIIPFTWGVAAIQTGIFLMILIPMAIVAVSMHEIFHLHGSGLPGVPSCFKKGTKIETKDGKINIEDIQIGSKLNDGSKVTAIFKLDASQQEMYILDGVCVSGNHHVFYENKWISVEKHPNANKCETFTDPIIYCINTTSKTIKINNTTFQDWDHMKEFEYQELSQQLGKDINKNNLADELENGFTKDFTIILKNNKKCKITDVNVNDILGSGEKIVGIVEIDGSKIQTYHNNLFSGSENVKIYYKNLGISTIKTINSKLKANSEKYDKLYHLITDKGFFKINGITFLDYHSNIDTFLKKKK